MAAVAINFVSACLGGTHIIVTVSIDGGPVRQFILSDDDIRTPISADDQLDALRALLRIHMRGKTRLEAKADLQTGINMVI